MGTFFAVLFPLHSVPASFLVCLFHSHPSVKKSIFMLSGWGQFNSPAEVSVLKEGLGCSQNTHLKPKRDQLFHGTSHFHLPGRNWHSNVCTAYKACIWKWRAFKILENSFCGGFGAVAGGWKTLLKEDILLDLDNLEKFKTLPSEPYFQPNMITWMLSHWSAVISVIF